MITASIVPVSERINFFPSITKQYIHFEQAVYFTAEKLIEGYSGGFWEFVELSDGGKFCYPVSGSTFFVSNSMNYGNAELSPEATGICVFLIMLSHYSMSVYHNGDASEYRRLNELYYSVESYARTLTEWPKMQCILD